MTDFKHGGNDMKDLRISTLEALLREIFREVIDSETNSISLTSFKSIQKELGEE